MKKVKIGRFISVIILSVVLLAACLIISLIIYASPLINKAIQSNQIMLTREHNLPEAEARFRAIQNDLQGLPTQSVLLKVLEDRVVMESDLPHCIIGIAQLLYGSAYSYEELITIFSEEFVEKRGWHHEGFNLGYVGWNLDINPQHQYHAPDSDTSIDINWWSKEAAIREVNVEAEYNTYYRLGVSYTDLPCDTA